MKRLLILLLLFIPAFTLFATDYYYVKADVLNVRSQPSKSGSIVGVVKKGNIVTAESEVYNGWIKISTSTISGYVSTEYLRFSHSKDKAQEKSEDNNIKLLLKRIIRKAFGWFIPILLIIISFSESDKSEWFYVLDDGTLLKKPTKDDGGCALFFIGLIWLGIKIYNLF